MLRVVYAQCRGAVLKARQIKMLVRRKKVSPGPNLIELLFCVNYANAAVTRQILKNAGFPDHNKFLEDWVQSYKERHPHMY